MLGPVIGPSSRPAWELLLLVVAGLLPFVAFFARWPARLVSDRLGTSYSRATWAIRASAVGLHLIIVVALAASGVAHMWLLAAVFNAFALAIFWAYRAALGVLGERDDDAE